MLTVNTLLCILALCFAMHYTLSLCPHNDVFMYINSIEWRLCGEFSTFLNKTNNSSYSPQDSCFSMSVSLTISTTL